MHGEQTSLTLAPVSRTPTRRCQPFPSPARRREAERRTSRGADKRDTSSPLCPRKNPGEVIRFKRLSAALYRVSANRSICYRIKTLKREAFKSLRKRRRDYEARKRPRALSRTAIGSLAPVRPPSAPSAPSAPLAPETGEAIRE